MGWASGSRLAEEIWDLVKEYIPDENKFELADKIYHEFCMMDADAWTGGEGSLYLYANPLEELERAQDNLSRMIGNDKYTNEEIKEQEERVWKYQEIANKKIEYEQQDNA